MMSERKNLFTSQQPGECKIDDRDFIPIALDVVLSSNTPSFGFFGRFRYQNIGYNKGRDFDLEICNVFWPILDWALKV